MCPSDGSQPNAERAKTTRRIIQKQRICLISNGLKLVFKEMAICPDDGNNRETHKKQR